MLKNDGRERCPIIAPKSECVWETCTILEDTFLEMFDSLQNPETDVVSTLKNLKKYVKTEGMKIDQPRFSFLLGIIASQSSRSITKAAYRLIRAFTKLELSVFIEMAPPNLLDFMYSQLFRTDACEIITRLVHIVPVSMDRLLELGLVSLVASKLSEGLDTHSFPLALGLAELIIQYTGVNPVSLSLMELLFQAVSSYGHAKDHWITVIEFFASIAQQIPAFCEVIEQSQAFSDIFTHRIRKSEAKQAVIQLLISLALPQDQKALVFLSNASILSFVTHVLQNSREETLLHLCRFLALCARNEEGRVLMVTSGLAKSLLDIANDCSGGLFNEIVKLTSEVVLSESLELVQSVLSYGFVDLLCISIDSSDDDTTKASMKAISRILSASQTGNWTEVLDHITDTRIPDSVNSLLDDSDDETAELAAIIITQLEDC